MDDVQSSDYMVTNSIPVGGFIASMMYSGALDFRIGCK
jgi:hypothetical protein